MSEFGATLLIAVFTGLGVTSAVVFLGEWIEGCGFQLLD